MEYIKGINNRDSTIGNTGTNQDNCIREMYSCGRKEGANTISNLIGLAVIVSIICFVAYRYIGRPQPVGTTQVLQFISNHEIPKLFVGLLLLTHVKTLSNSLISNIILPVIKPILPLISCNLKIKVGLFCLNIGDFVSDLIVFSINVYIIYLMYAIVY